MFLNGVLGLTIPMGKISKDGVDLLVFLNQTGYPLRLTPEGSLLDLSGRALMSRDPQLRDTYLVLVSCVAEVDPVLEGVKPYWPNSGKLERAILIFVLVSAAIAAVVLLCLKF